MVDEIMREYVGVIWIDDEPGERFSFLARSGEEAEEQLKSKYGEGHQYTLYNEEDRDRKRSGD
jgi:hypothetical protein